MKLYFFTGAGVSAESGIPTYRDVVDGLWYNHKIEDVATSKALQKDPQRVFDFFNAMTKRLREHEPNAAHVAIAELEKKHSVVVVTQNVDDLHEQAGSTNVIHLHGNLSQMRSTPKLGRSKTQYYPYDRDIKIGDLADDGTQLRPHVVLFGEQVPNMIRAKNEIDDSDALVIVGTTLEVFPASSIVECFLHDRKPIYYIDPNPNQDYRDRINYIAKKASEGMLELNERIEAIGKSIDAKKGAIAYISKEILDNE